VNARAALPQLNLALQGGGAHGAFTWGVLDAVLERATVGIGWISGTSAGAVNAVACASGLSAASNPDAARASARSALGSIWQDVAATSGPDVLSSNPLFKGWTEAAAAAWPSLASVFSPYDLNPLGLDPLGDILRRHVDFARLRATRGPELLIAATEVSSGRPHLFRRRELTAEMVLASACLPMLHHTVMIDGKGYWDGGYSANPDILTLAMESPVEDTLIVQLNPATVDGLPTSARAIAAHVNHLTFQQPLLRDIGFVLAARRSSQRWIMGPRGPYARLARHRFHLIDAGRHVASLPPGSKVSPDRRVIDALFAAGREEALGWIERHRADLGQRETVDLGKAFPTP